MKLVNSWVVGFHSKKQEASVRAGWGLVLSLGVLLSVPSLAGINGHISGCDSSTGLCTAKLNWDVKAARKFVVTVEVPGNGSAYDVLPRVFSCGDSAGNGEAAWIGQGQTYIFKVFESENCSAAVAQHAFAVDRLSITAQGKVVSPVQLQGIRNSCGTNGLCNYDLFWNARQNQKTVLTVEVWGQSGEKVMSCGQGNGQANAEWITKGGVYRFRLYESNRCAADVGKFVKPSAQIAVLDP